MYLLPNEIKNKMPTKNMSRKNKPVKQVTVEKPMASATNEDDFISILVNNAPPTRKTKKKPVEQQQEEAAPAPPIPDWEKVGMTQEKFETMMAQVAKDMRSWQMENYRNKMVNDLNSVSYWEDRIDMLEMQRERYNRKRAWSAKDILAIEEIDEEIAECEENIYELEEY